MRRIQRQGFIILSVLAAITLGWVWFLVKVATQNLPVTAIVVIVLFIVSVSFAVRSQLHNRYGTGREKDDGL